MYKKFMSVMSALLVLLMILSGCSPNKSPSDTSSSSVSSETATQTPTQPKVDYPKKEIQVIVPYKAGGDTDIYARTVLAQAQEALGVSIVVVNVEGAGGTIGTRQVAEADPDGYTVLWMQPNMLLNYVTGLIDITYDAFTGTAISVKTRASVLAVSADSPYNDVNDLIKDMQERPGEVIFATQVGGYTHMAALALEKAASAKLKKVDVGGGANQITALMGGHSDVCVVEAGVTKDYFESGDIKALVNLGNERSPFLPDLPTVFEQGANFEVGMEKYFFTTFPKDTPQEICDIFNAAVKTASESQAAKDGLANLYAEPAFIAGEDAVKYLDDATEYYSSMKDALKNDTF